MHFAQIKAGTPTSVIDQFGKGVGQATRPHIVDSENGCHRTQSIAMVDHLLGTPLNFGVAALHRIKIEGHAVAATGQGTGCSPAHANAHPRATQLNQQSTWWEFDFAREFALHHAQTTGDHDGLVVAALHAIDHLLVLAEIAQQIGTAKLVVESRAAQRALGHDGQGAGHVGGLAHFAAPKFGDAKAS